MPVEIGGIDGLIAVVLLGSMALGAKRGVIREVFSLWAWGLGFYLASHFCSAVATHSVLTGLGNVWLRQGVSFISIMALVLAGTALLANIIRVAVRSIGLGPFDHVLGAGFGALRGALIVMFFAVLANWLHLTGNAAWQQAWAKPWVEWALDVFAGELPAELSRFMTL
jgi:membrane protein required for colicin V production